MKKIDNMARSPMMTKSNHFSTPSLTASHYLAVPEGAKRPVAPHLSDPETSMAKEAVD
jgi:hypothetical protein